MSEKIKKEAEEIAKGTQYEKILQGKNGKYADGSEIKKLEGWKAFWHATWCLMKSDFGDKTFLIVFLFTLGWSNPKIRNSDEYPGYAVFADGHHFI